MVRRYYHDRRRLIEDEYRHQLAILHDEIREVAEGQVQPFSGLTGVALTVKDAAVGNATLNPDGTLSGVLPGP